ncbi:myosin heavy chain, cardiac muscle isoform [Bombyx mori]|uniref:Ofd1 protein n=1 Tax=Bombyx mori TaxID=7091 RepID=A0A8R1WLB7_BOMMO|nr:myosin heavy chain, cardiac muscle isoform isoform X2 [Bombyx mori]
MGIAFSSTQSGRRDAVSVTSESETISDAKLLRTMEDKETELDEEEIEDDVRVKAREDEMNEFKKQLNIKREQRKEILSRHRTEKENLEKSLHDERVYTIELCECNKQLRELLIRNNIEIPENLRQPDDTHDISLAVVQLKDEFEKLKSLNNKLRQDLADSNKSLQDANSDIADLHAQNRESMKQISALKEVVTASKTMINLREDQLNGLKNKLQEIEKTLADRETNLLSADLRQEYEKQLQNIRTLRGLYEERARLAELKRLGLVRDLEEQKRLHQTEMDKSKELKLRIDELETKVDTLHDIIENKNNQISSCQDEMNEMKAEMAVIHKLFSQVLLGYKSKQDLDKLVHRLEENHGLLTHMAEKENGSELSTALPKLLLELVSQVEDNEETNNNEENLDDECKSSQENHHVTEEAESHIGQNTTAEEIVENLPKVWKVLMELLSHQTIAEPNISEKVTTCYKSVETKSGPVLVPSVSQTYIRLKDLIIEKLGLVKEVNRMKQLNSHLETRLQEQEKRLCLVTTELSKTWHVVSRLRKHHHQLHTHEKILKYELQQKRKLLNELKEELEYCREKWEQAREKNTQSERDWKKLRAEFSSRKTKTNSLSLNNSAESGYSDERPSDESSESNDESEYVTEPLVRCKKKMKKSFENILDSSTDFNLAAEREDPVSDMIDVADLPLDNHDVDNDQEDVSEISKSEMVLKSDKTCDETEDELCDIAHDDSPIEETAIEPGCSEERDKANTTIISIDPAEILRNIRNQNERLARKDEKLEQLEKSSISLLKKTQATIKLGDEINSTLDHLLNRPTSSGSPIGHSSIEKSLPISIELDNEISKEEYGSDCSTLESKRFVTSESLVRNDDDYSAVDNLQASDSIQSETDLKTILENVTKQNERLSKKNERLKQLESGCAKVIEDLSNTMTVGENISKNLDSLLIEHKGQDETAEDEAKDTTDCQISEPSTSTEIDHEARFAARDLRLKRLEEQTKSLVTKVNKTTSKGVKIHYKLQELHNIYGSDNSRAGTPSEENDDKSTEDDASIETE